jgi:hypothetical protein
MNDDARNHEREDIQMSTYFHINGYENKNCAKRNTGDQNMFIKSYFSRILLKAETKYYNRNSGKMGVRSADGLVSRW